MYTQLKQLIDSQATDQLRNFLHQHPTLDLNNISSVGVSALWWAINPPANQTISKEVIKILLETNRIDPTQLWYGHRIYTSSPTAIGNLISLYEDNYVAQHEQQAGHLVGMAGDGQNTHNPLVVKQYDQYIKDLYHYYPSCPLAWQTSFDIFIKEQAYDRNPSLTKALQRIQNDKTKRAFDKDSQKGLNNTELLMLIWHALNDNNIAHLVPNIDISKEETTKRKRFLLDNLLEAQSTYGEDNPACFMGTRHLLIRTLDKVHITCASITTQLSEEYVAELYANACANAIKQLAIDNPALYEIYLGSFFIETDLKEEQLQALTIWSDQVKNDFWKIISNLQEETEPKDKLENEVFAQLNVMYTHTDFLLSPLQHKSALWAYRISMNYALLKTGNNERTFITPTAANLSTESAISQWLITHYSQNQSSITNYLTEPNDNVDPLYSLFLTNLDDSTRVTVSMKLWLALIKQLLTYSDLQAFSTDVILQEVELYLKEQLGEELALWVKHLPPEVKHRYFTLLLTPPQSFAKAQKIAFNLALNSGQLTHFPFSQEFTFNNHDFRGVDLSTIDLSKITFINCDLRLTKIMANPTLTARHLTSSQLELRYQFIATENGYLSPLQAYLENPNCENIAFQGDLNSLLQIGCNKNHLDIVKAILNKGEFSVFPDYQRYSHLWIALAQAIIHTQLDIINAILDKDSSLLFSNQRNSKTPLSLAIAQSKLAIVEIFLQHNSSTELLNYLTDDLTALMQAAKADNQAIFNTILDKNSSLEVLNAVNKGGYTVLMYAIIHLNNMDIVRTILNKNSSLEVLNAKNNKGRTALMQTICKFGSKTFGTAAFKENYPAAITLLLNTNSSIEILNTKDNNGKTPLMLAAEQQNDQIVRIILQKNSTSEVLNEKDNEGQTALMYAIKGNNPLGVKAILEANSSTEVLTAQDLEGKTPLVLAQTLGYKEIVDLLLAKMPEKIVNTLFNDKEIKRITNQITLLTDELEKCVFNRKRKLEKIEGLRTLLKPTTITDKGQFIASVANEFPQLRKGLFSSNKRFFKSRTDDLLDELIDCNAKNKHTR